MKYILILFITFPALAVNNIDQIQLIKKSKNGYIIKYIDGEYQTDNQLEYCSFDNKFTVIKDEHNKILSSYKVGDKFSGSYYCRSPLNNGELECSFQATDKNDNNVLIFFPNDDNVVWPICPLEVAE